VIGLQLFGVLATVWNKQLFVRQWLARLRFVLALVLSLTAVVTHSASIASRQPIFTGPQLDYQPAIIRVEPSGRLLVVFERLSATFSGDLYVTFSDDAGQTWSQPQAIVSSTRNERHPALVQLASGVFVLLYLKDESGSGSYRIYRATSADGTTWTEQGALDLGWSTPGEINPAAIREADGTLTMTYQRSGSSYIARSSDGGATWDVRKTMVSAGGLLPRIAKRNSDGRYLVTYQVNPGSNQLELFAKTTSDPYDWSAQASPVSLGSNSHDSQPIVLENGTFLVAYARQAGTAAFDIYLRSSQDGHVWSDEVRVTEDPTRYDLQPHPLLTGTPGKIMLLWSHQVSNAPYQDHDVWIDTNLVLPPQLWLQPSMYLPLIVQSGS